MKTSFSVKRLTADALLIAAAMILSYVESLVPLSVAVPGIKMGLANIAVVFTLYRAGTCDAFFVSILRVILISALLGTFVSFIYGFSGAAVSLAAMALLKRLNRFRTFTVSVTGGVVHNLTQIAAAMLILKTDAIVFYLPSLLIAGIISGAVIGTLAAILVSRIPKGLPAF